jgi:hypothetical protein
LRIGGARLREKISCLTKSIVAVRTQLVARVGDQLAAAPRCRRRGSTENPFAKHGEDHRKTHESNERRHSDDRPLRRATS